LSQKLRPKPAFFDFNSPNNPTGTVFDERALRGLAISRKNTICGCSATKFMRVSFLAVNIFRHGLCLEWRTQVIIDGSSKSFAMTGCVSVTALRPKHVIEAMDMLVLNTFTCAA